MPTKKCPFCAEEIQEEAIKCKHCGEWLDQQSTASPSPPPEPAIEEAASRKEPSPPPPERWYQKQKDWVVFLWLLLFFPVGVVLLWMNKSYSSNTKALATVCFGILFISVMNSVQNQESPPRQTKSSETGTTLESAVSIKIVPDQDGAQTLMVNVQVGNIRQKPTTEAAVVKQAKYGDFLTKKGEEGDWFRVSWAGGEGWVHNSIIVGEDGIREAGEKLLKETIAENEAERKRNISESAGELLIAYQELGMKKLEDQGFSVFVQWEEIKWAQLPFDTKKQILDSFKLMKDTRAIIHIYGYRSGRVLAETGVFSDTIN